MANPNPPPLPGPPDDLVGDFLDESSQLLARLNENLLRLEHVSALLDDTDEAPRAPDKGADLVNDMFRSVHSIKGLSGMLGLARINNLTHEIESVLDALRRDELAVNGQSVDQLFRACDRLTMMLDHLRANRGDQVPSGERRAGHNEQSATDQLPIATLFNRFGWLVGEIARETGKRIVLAIRGESIPLDKRLIDELAEPLVHLVRNAADHGIETPDERQAAGKSRQGTVTLRALRTADGIVIQVRDDGRGVDPSRIRIAAVAMGLVTAAAAKRLSNQAVYQLIWKPGFTTAAAVTALSGRGVGLDVVRSKIEQLGGKVELDSTPGVAATFTITLPLSIS
jgi:chemotaxis protein histidine kinase CheA